MFMVLQNQWVFHRVYVKSLFPVLHKMFLFCEFGNLIPCRLISFSPSCQTVGVHHYGVAEML